MKNLLLISLLIIFTELHSEEDFRDCEDIFIDQVTEMAFGDQSQPFTGKVKCYYDIKKTKIKSIRIFSKGIPIGSHFCHMSTNNKRYSIQYENGKKKKIGIYSKKTQVWIYSTCEKKLKKHCTKFFYEYCS